MDSVMSVVTLTIIAAYLFILVYTYLRRDESSAEYYSLSAAIIFSALASAGYLVAVDYTLQEVIGRGFLLVIMSVTALGAFGIVVIHDIIDPSRRQRINIIWFSTCAMWASILLMLALTQDTFIAGNPDWLVDLFLAPDASAWVTILGLNITGLALLIMAFYVFYKARLPEIANRALFWVLNTAIMLLAFPLITSGTDELAALGMVLSLTGLSGAVYASSSYRIFDLRNALILSVRTLSFVAIAAFLTFAALFVTLSADISTNLEGLLVISGIAILIAALYVPLRQITEVAIKRITMRADPDPSHITREYSAVVSQAVELDELLRAVTATLNRILRVQGSCLLLLNSTFKVKNSVELLVMYPGNDLDQQTGFVSIEGDIYATLAANRKPLSQFDIEFAPEYRKVSEEEKMFFRQLQMSAYAPVILENALIGILAVGQKLNDTAFYPRDLDLLSTLAQQTGIALRNARLVDDLQHLNKSMQSLNRTLKSTNEELQQMDSVKSDFVTIASHELRTPLAQIRGYSDIIDALNDQGMLDKDQTVGLVTNLRKATERMEELISAMLDVSQLDVDAMDLRLTDTSAESVLKMAIEPLTDAIKQRKLTLSARGLRGLPAIQADLQRLVQAFRNIIVNAIKFTPDGGRINITAQLIEAEGQNEVDKVLIAIKDSGVGIDKQNLEMIFKKFFRAYDPSLHSTGTYKFLGAGPGLGLTIARGVIEGHGGKVWAESESYNMETNPGTTFYVMLPISTPDDARRVLTFEGDAADKAINKSAEKMTDTHRKPPRSKVKGVEAP